MVQEYKYFPPDYRVRLITDEYTETTIIATFQKRFLGVFWKNVKEVNFDVYDYATLGKDNNSSEERREEIKRSSYQYVTISYDVKTVRELWHPKDFNLEKSLERHNRKLQNLSVDEVFT